MFGTSQFTSPWGLIDDFHNAAATSSLTRWAGAFYDASSRFLGTDVTENWTAAEAVDLFRPHFESNPKAWLYTPKLDSRVLNEVATAGGIFEALAYFDEALTSESFGPGVTSRGNGVLVKKGGFWFILQYHLSFPIPNALASPFCAAIAKHEAGVSANAAAEQLLAELELSPSGSGSVSGGDKAKAGGKKKGGR